MKIGVFVTGVLEQVDEMLGREERERCCCALNKELRAIEDDIRFEFQKSPTLLFCCILCVRITFLVISVRTVYKIYLQAIVLSLEVLIQNMIPFVGSLYCCIVYCSLLSCNILLSNSTNIIE